MRRTDWEEKYLPGDRKCPGCEEDNVVSKREADLVFNWSTDHDYLCSNCHIHL